MNSITDIPLQKRKQARTKLALLDATIEMMQKKAFADITVDEICEKVEVSKGTFFRYFPQKKDLIHYQIRLLSIEAAWHAKQAAGEKSGIAIIETVFEQTVYHNNHHPHFFCEVIALRASDPTDPFRQAQDETKRITLAERLLRFAGMEGIESIPDGNIFTIFQENLEKAVSNGELPKNIDIRDVILTLGSIFYGVPFILAHQTSTVDLVSAYKRQLKILWAGLKHTDWDEKEFQETGNKNFFNGQKLS